MTYEESLWTNPSVVSLAHGADPVSVIQSKARQMVVEVSGMGWDGPPYDPFQLAELRNISILPNDAIAEARTVPIADGLRIEFNPNRPQGRIRYSVAHEIAHTLFPDCDEMVRNRTPLVERRDDSWQLELLCNIGAAELLMPTGYTNLEKEGIDIDNLLRLRGEFDVSTEAILIRMAKLTSTPCAVFTAARVSASGGSLGFRIDYSVPSRAWDIGIPSNFRVESSDRS